MRRSLNQMALWALLVGAAMPGQGLAWPVGGVIVAPITTSVDQLEPRLVLGEAGAVLVYWSDDRWLDSDDLYGQLLAPAGTVAPGWPDTGLMIARAANNQRSGAGLAMPDGSFIVGMVDFRNSVPNGTGTDTYLSHVLADGRSDPAWPRQGFQAVNRADDDSPGYVLLVASDTLVTSCLFLTPDGLLRPLIQRVAITPSGPVLPWTPAGIAYQWRPHGGLTTLSLVPDGEGGLFVLFDEVLVASHVDSQADLYLMRIGRDGQPAAGWESGARPVSVAPGTQEYGVLASDGAGGLYAVWGDARNGSGLPFPDYTNHEDIRLLRLTREGAPAAGWPADGLLVSDAPGWQYLPALEPDGSGGVYVSFDDYSVGTIGLTRVAADGTFVPGWAKNGIPLTNSPAYDTESKLVRDGSGGVFVLFRNLSEGSLVLQHALRGGAVDPLWPSAGAEVGSGNGGSQMVSDGAGGCYVAFEKGRLVPASALVAVSRYSVDGVVPVKLAEATAEAEAGRVHLVWRGADGVPPDSRVQRRDEAGEGWRDLGAPIARGRDRLEFDDLTAEAGASYLYRLVRGAEVLSQELSVRVPAAAAFALAGGTPNPAMARELAVALSLTGAGAARLEVLDLAGRREYTRELVGLAPGRHTVALADAQLAPGVHWLRLSEGPRTAHARVVVVR
jgi:hypothetical protein